MRNFIEHITRKAGNTALKYFKKPELKFSHKKNIADVVTEADHASNKVLLDAIKKRFPAHGIISEETGEEQTSAEYVWIIDPLDGTRNFLTHTPLWGTMVGLARNKQMIAAAIYDPNHDELVYAERGKGAYLNGKRIHCSLTLPFSYGVINTILRSSDLRFITRLANNKEGEGVWAGNVGSAAMMAISVATGRRDWAVVSFRHIWDQAMLTLACHEAGCRTSDFTGKPWAWESRGIVVANAVLHKKLMRMVK
ncbi:hypothetical protein A3J43_01495 [Candidatus Uhrbacteria bacterium RIFCSPHIGHO2_12_FULL_54_23]|uniref:Inositol-1-monophosphatase n=3 Tax=Candidatus Uhriibacteriota TaxID=1752732 RepID=A0A1F7UM76_9BACT|nr:MAG: hypothetical protein A3J43_01495 [Candidatus Uhrbacteria bacterium RIFCSPHIGHO2_12_FULL_54_23]OGL85607.1 MAG: hypothetical protein A3B36_02770 [Candidatus Uhrbacteria bacterium RIFCSPLOWO2_01_FULL_55_36]OGL89557.1 MAG: hypothetical protein A3J36_02930 [Candidatus Uhrbacteria bacterium RIFCSPLOWO2_02_FULL_54_37]HLE17421.1 inositol monophosphatase family protein [Syntrophales bacterium]